MFSCNSSSPREEKEPAVETTDSLPKAAPAPPSHQCDIAGEVLEANQLWFREQNLLLCVVADSATYDENYGASHRILDIYDTGSCERIDRHVLPVNVSPDFPYYLAEVTYNSVNKLVAIHGFDRIYVYELSTRRLSPAMTPQYRNRRYGEDAQSGMILRLELWENYLVGFAEDYGAFVFSLEAPGAPEPVLPAAEYEVAAENYHQLFLLATNDGKYQGLLPSYDYDGPRFSVNPIFPDPAPLNPQLPPNVADNRYLVLRLQDEGRTPVAIDMATPQRVDLPADVRQQPTQQILQWLRQGGQPG